MIKSLYVHIPFCIKKCLYCDFNSFSDNSLQEEYIEALVQEIKMIKNKSFNTIFIGGGTPTILSMHNMEKLLKELYKLDFQEFTIEANPGTLSKEKLELMKTYGVNRLSIGLQAWQDRLLEKLGRVHKLKDFIDSFNLARSVGFNNINVDLMFAIPDQALGDWKETIENVIGLEPEHISSYSLIVEENTPYFNMNEEGELHLPDEETERQMYRFAVDKLNASGLHQYEISNFAKPGFESRHNITYWKDEQYIGCGAGAHSYIGHSRFSNITNIKDYIKGIKSGNTIQEITELDVNDEMSEFMFMGLRMIKGIEKQRFKERFGTSIESVYSKEIDKFVANGLIIDTNDSLSLTPRGVELSNQVFVDFLK